MVSACKSSSFPKTQLKSQLLFATFPDFPLPLPDSHFLLWALSGLHANVILKALTAWLGVL